MAPPSMLCDNSAWESQPFVLLTLVVVAKSFLAVAWCNGSIISKEKRMSVFANGPLKRCQCQGDARESARSPVEHVCARDINLENPERKKVFDPAVR